MFGYELFSREINVLMMPKKKCFHYVRLTTTNAMTGNTFYSEIIFKTSDKNIKYNYFNRQIFHVPKVLNIKIIIRYVYAAI